MYTCNSLSAHGAKCTVSASNMSRPYPSKGFRALRSRQEPIRNSLLRRCSKRLWHPSSNDIILLSRRTFLATLYFIQLLLSSVQSQLWFSMPDQWVICRRLNCHLHFDKSFIVGCGNSMTERLKVRSKGRAETSHNPSFTFLKPLATSVTRAPL